MLNSHNSHINHPTHIILLAMQGSHYLRISYSNPQFLIRISQHISNTSSYHNHAHICRNHFLRRFIITTIHIPIPIVIALRCISHYHRSLPPPTFSPSSLSPLCPAPRSHWSKPEILRSHWSRARATRPSLPQGPGPGFPTSDFAARHDFSIPDFEISNIPI